MRIIPEPVFAKGDHISVSIPCAAGDGGEDLEYGHVVTGTISMRDPEGLGTYPEPHLYLDLGLAGKGWYRVAMIHKEEK